MRYILGMVTSSILALTETIKDTASLALTDVQVAALQELSAHIEWIIQDRALEIQDADRQVENFEADEFRKMDFESDRITFSGPFFDIGK